MTEEVPYIVNGHEGNHKSGPAPPIRVARVTGYTDIEAFRFLLVYPREQ
ncbi:MAG: hypothetical protein MUE45_01310 [Methanoregulaceae archaeon]|nr:hypothetical protein [Methanoregulaceae archaeon]MCU0628115.1 hypothetical protein [Methanoregulaceae archaeon]